MENYHQDSLLGASDLPINVDNWHSVDDWQSMTFDSGQGDDFFEQEWDIPPSSQVARHEPSSVQGGQMSLGFNLLDSRDENGTSLPDLIQEQENFQQDSGLETPDLLIDEGAAGSGLERNSGLLEVAPAAPVAHIVPPPAPVQGGQLSLGFNLLDSRDVSGTSLPDLIQEQENFQDSGLGTEDLLIDEAAGNGLLCNSGLLEVPPAAPVAHTVPPPAPVQILNQQIHQESVDGDEDVDLHNPPHPLPTDIDLHGERSREDEVVNIRRQKMFMRLLYSP